MCTNVWENKRVAGLCQLCDEGMREDMWYVALECSSVGMETKRDEWMETMEQSIREHMSESQLCVNKMSEWVRKVRRRGRINSESRDRATEEREFWRGWLWEWCENNTHNWHETKTKGVRVASTIMRGWWDMWVRRCEIRQTLKKEEINREREERINILAPTLTVRELDRARKWDILQLRRGTGNSLI